MTGIMKQMSTVWAELRAKRQFIDATLVCSDGVNFPVHRIILASYSKLFKVMFTTPMYMDENNRVVLENMASQEMNVLLEWMYGQELNITTENVTKLLHAAEYLDILDVHKACVDFLEHTISHMNCLTIRQFARDHFLGNLEVAAQKFLLQNFAQIAESSVEILSLPADELASILASDQLNVRNEEIVWNLVLRWLEHEKESRLVYFGSLLNCIRLGLMEAQYFLEHVKGHPYVKGNQDCRPVIINTLKVLMDVETITQKDGAVQTPECAQPRIPHEILFAIGGWSGGSPTNAVESYDTRADRWINVPEVDPSGPRAYHGTAVIGSDIYVIGGFDGMENFNSCRKFNVVTKTWQEIAPMHERRCYVSVAEVNKAIFALGGYNGQHRQNSAEKYDYLTNQWTMIAPMHTQRSDASATVINGKIYITGGFDGRECLSSAEYYDPETNIWTMLPPMQSRRSGVSCIAYHDSLYVLGGFNGTSRMSSVEKFCFRRNQWSALPDMYTTRSNFAIEVIDDMVFAIGGFNGIATIHKVECFDESTNEWYEATDMNVFRSALSACVIKDIPNLNDFIHQNRHMLMEEKRQKLLEQGQNNTVAHATEPNSAVVNISQAIQEVNNDTDLEEVVDLINDEDMAL